MECVEGDAVAGGTWVTDGTSVTDVAELSHECSSSTVAGEGSGIVTVYTQTVGARVNGTR